jgi:hypothetical protein
VGGFHQVWRCPDYGHDLMGIHFDEVEMTRLHSDVHDGKPIDLWITRLVKAIRKN